MLTGGRSLNWFVINPWKDDDEVLNIWKSYDVNCAVKNYIKVDYRSHRRNRFSSRAKSKDRDGKETLQCFCLVLSSRQPYVCRSLDMLKRLLISVQTNIISLSWIQHDILIWGGLGKKSESQVRLGFFSESSSNVVSSLIIVNKGKKGKKEKRNKGKVAYIWKKGKK